MAWMFPHTARALAVAMIAALAAPGVPATAVAAESAISFEASQAAVVTAQGKFDFSVELALTPEQQAHGLMHRKYLPPAAGMLFDFREDRVLNMWMKNTLIPLDMLFLDAAGTIVGIAENTTPRSLRNISSGRPARAVLEVNGGTARRIGAAVGDRVVHPIFQGS